MSYLRKRLYRKISITVLLILSLVVMAACSPEGTDERIVLADAGWDSLAFHNEVAALIIENGYGYSTYIEMGSTPITFAALRNGSIDVYMELWTDNIIEAYTEALEEGDIIEVSTNFDDNAQGLYVPTYVIEGDAERGIEPMAPGLRSVQDLPDYWEVFKDPEDSSKGRIYGAIPGWEVDEILQQKVKTHGLDENYNYFSPGSDTALGSSIIAAIERGEAWLGYYWEPTWIIGMYDMTLLEDIPYDEEKWNDGYATEMPAVDVTVAVHKDMPEKAPEIVAFLENYQTSSAVTSEALAYMQANDATTEEAAVWFLKEYEDLWTAWVPEEVAEAVKEAIQ
ncbi:ABC-type proline/glycine betaine transport system, periplasmic component [Clostridium aceticum]|uniref:ABC-type proline/glycine betaine transport system, periplasmic component n=1 Tax=Clostridium aceticum TaxID=84022 RepID=A0A0D8IBP4_9CLOT|nr:ABC transporter substrate-binding protein [Clostridium aceticum]AKL96752.1 ABC-type proline/glycine betaine transport system, periplasmic component [Clostridium aceticum]KJF27514.1 ABC transporter substrate-binding protein [Clostridium aceticum]